MEHAALSDLLREAVYVFTAAVAVLALGHRLRIPPLVGLLLTGILIGPSGFEVVSNREGVELFAELGVVLLLFAIGLEVSLAQLRELRLPFVVGGGGQVLTTVAIGAGLAKALGFPTASAIFFGFVVSLSSTAIVLKLYAARHETRTPQARISLGILLFQDFAIVPMLVLIPVLAGDVAASPASIAGRFSAAIAAVAVTFWIARRVMPVVLHHVASTRVRELSVLGALALCLGMAWVTYSLGLSVALGAFVAGLIVSETEYTHQVIADVAPFRDVFASLFFVSMGMLVDLDVARAHAPLIAALAAGVLLVKSLTAGVAVRLLGYPERTVVMVALGLAQVGEFSFVLMEVGHEHGLLAGDRFQIVLAAAVATMLATPFLVALAPRLADRWADRRLGAADSPTREGDAKVTAELTDHVVIVGFGVNGRLLARVLREAAIPYLILELAPEVVRAARGEGQPILFGDSTRREILEHAGVAHAQVVVFAISDPEALRGSIRLARSINPKVEIIARTHMVQEIQALELSGADQVIAEEFETAIEIFTRVLGRYHVPRNVIRAQTLVLRGEHYRMLRSPQRPEGVSQAVIELLTMGTTDVFRVDSGAFAAGKTLAEIDLRRRTEASVIAIVRDESPLAGVDASETLHVADDVVLVGGHAAVEAAFEWLERGPATSGE